MAGLETLEKRRIGLVDSFAKKTSKNPRYSAWFPRVAPTDHNIRERLTYQEEFARTERYKNSPVFYMRRRLNWLETEQKKLKTTDLS